MSFTPIQRKSVLIQPAPVTPEPPRKILESDKIPTHAPIRTLSPISFTAMNALNGSNSPSPDYSNSPKNRNSTIRSVPSVSLSIDTSPRDEAARRPQSKSDSSVMPHSTKIHSTHPQPVTRPTSNLIVTNGVARRVSSEFGLTTSFSSNSLFVPEDSSASSNGNTASPNSGGPGGTAQWSSAVGRANLGKSGRVIERLMGENDMLKREVKIERLKAEESKFAVKMTESKMEQLVADYDSKLHDAVVNKTLLKRRERQLAELRSQIDAERDRANKAVENERWYKDEMEKTAEDCKRKVEDADARAKQMEARNETMARYWKDQEELFDNKVDKVREEIDHIIQERIDDDERMNKLQEFCEQQAAQLTALQSEKQNIAQAFEDYKKSQEDLLRNIKERARRSDEAAEAALEDTRKVLGQLKWALNVKENVKGAY